MTPHESLMRLALEEAGAAFREGEVPVGAVVAKDGRPVARAHNLREQTGDPTAHAELLAIREAARVLGARRLTGCTLYVTLEPCPMCAGAIINSRVRRVIYGAADKKAGSCGSVVDMFALPYNHRPEVTSGVLEEECSALLTEFFGRLREKRKVMRNEE